MTVRPGDTDRYQILALSGGGFRGLYSARFLERCETSFGIDIAKRFNLIAGTSIGALIAAGLGLGVPTKTIVSKFEEHGKVIFNKRLLTSARRKIVSAPYTTESVANAIKETLGDAAEATLDEIDAPLLIVAVNYTTGAAALFRSRGLAGGDADSITVEDAILASAAAPTFFPIKKIEETDFIDGGLIANAPDLSALIDACTYHNADFSRSYMLSIGTASRREGAAVHSGTQNHGGIDWVKNRGLIETVMAAQETLSIAQAVALLGSRFLRVDQEPAANQVADIAEMDEATEAATRTLRALAEQSWERHRRSRKLRDYFVR